MNNHYGYVELVVGCIHTQFTDYQFWIPVIDRRKSLVNNFIPEEKPQRFNILLVMTIENIFRAYNILAIVIVYGQYKSL